MSLARTMESLMAGNSVIRKMFEMGQDMAKQYDYQSLGEPGSA